MSIICTLIVCKHSVERGVQLIIMIIMMMMMMIMNKIKEAIMERNQ